MKASPVETKFYYIENKIKTPVEEGYSISDSDNEMYTNYQNCLIIERVLIDYF